jgi:hypothetical protein
LFNKHLGRYLLGPHLTGDLAFAQPCEYNHLQAAQLLSEAALLIETEKHFLRQADTSFPIPHVLQQIIDQVLQQGRFNAAAMHRLTGILKGPGQ